MEKRFEQILRQQRLIVPGDGVLVALSGGADSVTLLHLLLGLKRSWGLRLGAAHLDHCMREDSGKDLAFVRELCAELEIPLFWRRIDVPKLCRAQKGGLEAVARQARRAFLCEVAQAQGFERIALGHHRDDQAETLLHRLVRGSASAGLCAMRPLSAPFVRPLLEFSRKEIQEYVQRQGLSYVEDESNRDPRFTRNRIRHQLLPLLRQFNPQVGGQLARLAGHFALEEDYWAQEVSGYLGREGWGEQAGALDALRLSNSHPALRKRVIREAIRRWKGTLQGIESSHLEAIAGRLPGGGNWDLHLPGLLLGCRYGRVAPVSSGSGSQASILVEGPGRYALGDGRLLVVSRQCSAAAPSPSGRQAEFDEGEGFFPLEVRGRRPGDVFRPSGMEGRRKLKDFFIDLKLPRQERDAIPLVFRRDELLWIPGIRRCEGGWPGQGKPRILLEIREETEG